MQQYERPAMTTYVRYSQSRATSFPLRHTARLELGGLFILVCLFWGIILFEALAQAM